MTPRQKTRWGVILTFALLTAALGGGAWHVGYRQALAQLSQRGAADLALASDRLGAQLKRYRELAVLTGDDPALKQVVSPSQIIAAEALLQTLADKTSAMDVLFVGADGRVRAAAHAPRGTDLSETSHFRRALHGALGHGHGTDTHGRRAFYYAAPSFADNGRVRGAVIVSVDMDDIEFDWRGSTPAVFFTDDAGYVFSANRSELLGWVRPSGQAGLVPQTGPAPPFEAQSISGHDIWCINWGPYLPQRALHLVRDLPVIGLRGEVLVDVAPAQRLAALQAATVAALCLAFGALLFLATERRRTLAEANARLEEQVARRTAALTQTNVQLRREVAERQEAETALKRAQNDLVQAGKLSALGQMSAGISHELNQPLMAIRSFAENGGQFLDRDQPDVARGNFDRISDLARRMGRIIQNLRAFARQESETMAQVELVTAIEAAIELVQSRLRQDAITLDWAPPSQPIWVRGGEVRLSQVFVNLMTNAADAMEGSDPRILSVSVSENADAVAVCVADTGAGIADSDRLFDPFYSTKPIGASEGMGLGLSISYGLVQSFGGEIRGRNRDTGGAEFTVQLPRWHKEEAA